MKRIELSNGVVSLSDDITPIVRSLASSPPLGTRGGRLPRRPIALATVEPVDGGDDAVMQAMLAQDMDLALEFEVDRAPATKRGVEGEPTRVEWQGARPDEDAVVLLEADGVYSWRYGKELPLAVPATRNRGAAFNAPVRTLVFDLGPVAGLDSGSAAATHLKRTWDPLGAVVLGKIRGWIFRFVARFAAEHVVAALERKRRVGLVLMGDADPLNWSALGSLRRLSLPSDRTPRILLFVHGTFSSTLGSFGYLGATAWGRSFLADAAARYDAIVGFDHLTLADNPFTNARQLIELLEDVDAPALDLDVICFSRGGLVVRCLTEYLLPSARLPIHVRRAAFIAATNSGTELASPKNWKRLVDLTTNLVAAGSRALGLFAPPAALATTIVNHAIGSIGALVKALAVQALEEHHVPGLAAMVPDGPFVTDLNLTQPGQPTAATSMYYAITSEFDVRGVPLDGKEIPAGLARWLADTVVDSLMRGAPNDLVVHNESTVTIDSGAGAFIKDRLHFPANPIVYHTNFFTRNEVTERIRGWFGFGPPVTVAAATARGSSGESRLQVVDTTEPLVTAIAMLGKRPPEFIVARRVDGSSVYHYAFRPEELAEVARQDPGALTRPIEEALARTHLRLGEDSSSDEDRAGRRRGWLGNRGATTRRTVVFDGSTIVGVRDELPRSTAELAALDAAMRPVPRIAQPAAAPAAPRAALRRAESRRAGSGDTASEGATSMHSAPSMRSMESETTGAYAIPPLELGPSVETATEPPPITIYASAETSETIRVDAVVALTVDISRDEIAASASSARASGTAEVSTSKPLIVQVVPKRNLEIVGESRVEVDPAADRTQLVFDLKGLATGPGEVWVILRQGAQVLLTLTLKPSIVARTRKPSSAVTRDAAEAVKAPTEGREYPVLYVYEIQVGNQVSYRFTLQLSPLESYTADSAPLRAARAAYVKELYERIEGFWTSTRADVDAFTQELRAFGGQLFDELIPREIQKALWAERDQLDAILVMAEEPFIPWELVHLKPPHERSSVRSALPPDSHFLGQKGLVRWLHNRTPMVPRVHVRRGRSRYVIPEYPGNLALPAAQQEIPFLKQKFGAQRVDPVTESAIRGLLSTPGVDHFHFSGHGEADALRAAVDAALLLSMSPEGNVMVPRYLNSTVVGQSASLMDEQGNRPLVMLNACQVGRAGWHLTSIGGFAEAFVNGGAAIFVGSLWAVGDAPARTFSEAFYSALLDEAKPLALAATAGREASRAAGDATWMAYVVYGYPYATVTSEVMT